MDKRKVEEWLDKLIEAVKLYEDSRIFNQDIQSDSIRFYAICVRNLRMVSVALDIPLLEKKFDCDGATANEIEMHYKGVTFYELENYKGRGEQ